MTNDDELDEVERAEQEVEQLQGKLHYYKSRAFISAAMLVLITLVAVIAALYLDGFARFVLVCGAALSAVAFVFDLNRKRGAVEQCRRKYEQANSRLDQTRKQDA